MSQFKITSFFGNKDQRDPQSSTNRNVSLSRPKKRQKKGSTSSFGTCPLCSKSIPNHSLEVHASKCNGRADESDGTSVRSRTSLVNGQKSALDQSSTYLDFDDQPIEGLFVFENFITEEEEQEILAELDGKAFSETFLPWKASKFNGKHLGKRWGVHCNLRDRMVSEAENPLPNFMNQIIIPKLRLIRQMSGCIPNECNAIDYRRDDGHFLTAHVDDRQLSKEPIANLSLAGDCFMTFRNQTPQRNNAVASARVLLPQRCLQVMTGRARYDFSHGISTSDIVSDRRVSVTMRESPLSARTLARLKMAEDDSKQYYLKMNKKVG